MQEKIVIASDHAGYDLKTSLIAYLSQKGYEVTDLGCPDAQSVDYPDYANKLAGQITDTVKGILICGSGIGMSIAANRYNHIRGALVSSVELATLARQHNNANVLILGARFIDENQAFLIADTFFTTAFDGGRHACRLAKIGG